MRGSWIIVALFLVCLESGQAFSLDSLFRVQGVGGGGDCAACTVVLSLVEQLSLIHNKTVENLLDEVCDWLLPPNFASICDFYVNTYGADVIKLFDQGHNPDEVCHGIAFCTLPQCRLWGPTGRDMPQPKDTQNKRAQVQIDPWAWILELLAPIIQKAEPVLDFDSDLFSPEPTLRGSNWRGRDCNDFDAAVYPGRDKTTWVPQVDHNCNGIYEKNNVDYEKIFCSNSGQLGTVVVGDSAGAHFSIPPQWMNASEINSNTYKDLLDVLSNEIDWPHRSATTGFVPSTDEYTVHSLYLHMRERNLCNHRDYQNIARNGVRSGSAIDMAKTVARNQTLDHPVLLVLELIGNDVCSGHPDFNHYTQPAEFKQNILTILEGWNSTLPKGSHVMFIGLAQGGILYETLHNRKHPIGATYNQVYDYLNCLEISPCWTWMNSNATVRAMGDKWAATLSAIYQEIIDTHTYKNFDMIYYPFPLADVYQAWLDQGGVGLWQLIEPVDGFHPNQIDNYLTGDWYLKVLQRDRPEWLGNVNPYNAQIQQIFGDQNGY